MQGKKTVTRKKASREPTALPQEPASPDSKTPDRGPCGAWGVTAPLPAETEEPDAGTGESNLITSLTNLCKSKVIAGLGAGLLREDLGAQVHGPEVVPLSSRKAGWP